MNIMPIDNIPDWEQRLARQDAFWDCEVIDRPVVSIAFAKGKPEYEAPKSHHSSIRDRWMDSEYHADLTLAYVMNTEFMGDALPSSMPNLGPEFFSAIFGCELEYTNDTAWAIPCLKDWDEVDKLKFSRDNFYWKKLIEMTDVMLEKGKGKFYTGITDLHPGGDAVAGFRDPEKLLFDLMDVPDKVKSLLDYITEVYKEVYDFYYEKMIAANQAICTWIGIVSTKKWLVPSNDFSCMVSPQMFREFFLPAIETECQHYEASIYHLDGPGALKHLDALLEIDELSAIQWVAGAGAARGTDWMPIYKKCQEAGKGIQIYPNPDELDLYMQELKPNGVWIGMRGVSNREEGNAVIKKLLTWK